MEKNPKIKTKEKILLTAIEQYNKIGVQGITSRHIASEIGISHGNLDYHYKTKEDIILAIYDKMREEMSDYFVARKENISPIEHVHLLLLQLEEFQYRYRFMNLDVLEITRAYPKISALLQKTSEFRKLQMDSLFQEFRKEGYMIPVEPEILEQTQHIIRITITFWLSQREVLGTEKFTEKGSMVRSIWAVIRPYLTETGKKEQGKTIAKYGYIKQESTNEL
ncbi:TetR family transcriptional regulator [Algoriphagus ratkowskyi]|uniref:TetR family transcriptional regulator n=1 Tax=Algoriphagus ratkowskyi TaxID=57028 RepID=A0A2W7RFA9_9BACT|nr:TetR/AcrR family transcriptional regulator [Algoriphagus ratkowskyi]PZX59124.1 TetR family transcriptional regulator [Algoriphagus ratkowskyi]TXD77587.1 TetR/AcrR family transcriptional regulator [Algoriphagus ratkowskyi]